MVPDEHREWIDALLERYGVPPLPPPTETASASSAACRHAHRSQEHGAADRRRLRPQGGPDRLGARHAAGAGWSSRRTPAASRSPRSPAASITPSRTRRPASTSSSRRAPRAADTPARSPPWSSCRRWSTRSRRRPVLAAGGIATGRQVAAALALGAEGVWCGSVWLTTHEAETSPVIREKFLAATLGRHAPLALAHRQAGAHAAQRLDRRLGGAGRAGAARHAAAEHAGRRCAAPHPSRRPQGRLGRAHAGRPTSSARSSAR